MSSSSSHDNPFSTAANSCTTGTWSKRVASTGQFGTQKRSKRGDNLGDKNAQQEQQLIREREKNEELRRELEGEGKKRKQTEAELEEVKQEIASLRSLQVSNVLLIHVFVPPLV